MDNFDAYKPFSEGLRFEVNLQSVGGMHMIFPDGMPLCFIAANSRPQQLFLLPSFLFEPSCVSFSSLMKSVPPEMKATLYLIIVFCLAVYMEHVIVGLVLNRPREARWRILASVLLVNLITFPAIQLLALGLVICVQWGAAPLAAPLLPFPVEYFLLKWQFGKLHAEGSLQRRISNMRTLVATVAANAVSSLVVLQSLTVTLVWAYEPDSLPLRFAYPEDILPFYVPIRRLLD